METKTIKIQLLQNLPVAPRHGALKGNIYDAEEVSNEERGRGDVKYWIVSIAGERLGILPHEAQEVTLRLFTDRMHQTFEDKIRVSAQKRVGALGWLRSDHRGPTGKPYTLRRLGMIANGVPTEYARCDRRGRVFWHSITYGFTLETDSEAPLTTATPEAIS